MSTATPALLIVNGLPATGKTTLAKALANGLGWPALHKDDYKEILFDTLGYGTREQSRALGSATLALLYHTADAILTRGGCLILECNLHPGAAAPQLTTLLLRHNARCAQVFCTCSPEIRLQRFFGRARHPGHVDAVLADADTTAFLSESLEPVPLAAPLLMVDTTATNDATSVLAWVNRTLLSTQSR
jgi:predicted kinase